LRNGKRRDGVYTPIKLLAWVGDQWYTKSTITCFLRKVNDCVSDRVIESDRLTETDRHYSRTRAGAHAYAREREREREKKINF